MNETSGTTRLHSGTAGADRIKLVVYTTVFGVLWGLSEMFLGTYLKMLNVPLRGAVLAGIGGVLLASGRLYTPVRGATLSTGLIAAAVKMFSFSAFKLSPVSAILVEALIVEIVFSVFGKGRAAVFCAVVCASLEGVPHFFLSNWLIYGGGIFGAYMDAVAKIQKMLGLAGDVWLKVVAVWVGGHLLLGVIFGLAAVAVTGRIRHETE